MAIGITETPVPGCAARVFPVLSTGRRSNARTRFVSRPRILFSTLVEPETELGYLSYPFTSGARNALNFKEIAATEIRCDIESMSC